MVNKKVRVVYLTVKMALYKFFTKLERFSKGLVGGFWAEGAFLRLLGQAKSLYSVKKPFQVSKP